MRYGRMGSKPSMEMPGYPSSSQMSNAIRSPEEPPRDTMPHVPALMASIRITDRTSSTAGQKDENTRS
jgi:hypothetical protein